MKKYARNPLLRVALSITGQTKIVWLLIKCTEHCPCSIPTRYIYFDSNDDKIGKFKLKDILETTGLDKFLNVIMMKTKQKSWRTVLEFKRQKRNDNS